jgi:hypothetical protein
MAHLGFQAPGTRPKAHYYRYCVNTGL